MSFNTGTLEAKLIIDVSNLDKAANSVSQFTQHTSAKLVTMAQRFRTFGYLATTTLTMPLVRAGVAAIQVAKDYEFAIQKMVGLAGVAQKVANQWDKAILKMSPDVAKGPVELAEALYYISSSGIRGARALDVLTVSARAASAGLGRTQDVANLVTSALNAYAHTGLTAAEVTDVLVAGVREGKAEADRFAQSIGQIIPIASEMGVSFSDVVGGMAAITLTGSTAAQSATYLKGVFNSLMKSTEKGDDALKSVGSSYADLRRILKEQGLIALLQEVRDLSVQYGDTLGSDVFPNIRGLSAYLSIAGKNFEYNKGVLDRVRDSTGSLDNAVKAVSDTIQYRWQQVTAQLQTSLTYLGKLLGSTLLPILEAISNALKNFTEYLRELSEAGREGTVKFLGFLTALGPASLLLGTLSFLLMGVGKGLAYAASGALSFTRAILGLVGVDKLKIRKFLGIKTNTDEFIKALAVEKEALDKSKASYDLIASQRKMASANLLTAEGLAAKQKIELAERTAKYNALYAERELLGNKTLLDKKKQYINEMTGEVGRMDVAQRKAARSKIKELDVDIKHQNELVKNATKLSAAADARVLSMRQQIPTYPEKELAARKEYLAQSRKYQNLQRSQVLTNQTIIKQMAAKVVGAYNSMIVAVKAWWAVQKRGAWTQLWNWMFKMSQAVRMTGKEFGALVKQYGLFAAIDAGRQRGLFGGVTFKGNVAKATESVRAMGTATKFAAKAWTLGGWGVAIGILTLIGFKIAHIVKKRREQRDIENQLKDMQRQSAESMAEEITQLDILTKKLQMTNLPKELRIKLLKEYNDLYEETLGYATTELTTAEQLTAQYTILNQKIRDRITLEAKKAQAIKLGAAVEEARAEYIRQTDKITTFRAKGVEALIQKYKDLEKATSEEAKAYGVVPGMTQEQMDMIHEYQKSLKDQADALAKLNPLEEKYQSYLNDMTTKMPDVAANVAMLTEKKRYEAEQEAKYQRAVGYAEQTLTGVLKQEYDRRKLLLGHMVEVRDAAVMALEKLPKPLSEDWWTLTEDQKRTIIEEAKKLQLMISKNELMIARETAIQKAIINREIYRQQTLEEKSIMEKLPKEKAEEYKKIKMRQSQIPAEEEKLIRAKEEAEKKLEKMGYVPDILPGITPSWQQLEKKDLQEAVSNAENALRTLKNESIDLFDREWYLKLEAGDVLNAIGLVAALKKKIEEAQAGWEAAKTREEVAKYGAEIEKLEQQLAQLDPGAWRDYEQKKLDIWKAAEELKVRSAVQSELDLKLQLFAIDQAYQEESMKLLKDPQEKKLAYLKMQADAAEFYAEYTKVAIEKLNQQTLDTLKWQTEKYIKELESNPYITKTVNLPGVGPTPIRVMRTPVETERLKEEAEYRQAEQELSLKQLMNPWEDYTTEWEALTERWRSVYLDVVRDEEAATKLAYNNWKESKNGQLAMLDEEFKAQKDGGMSYQAYMEKRQKILIDFYAEELAMGRANLMDLKTFDKDQLNTVIDDIEAEISKRKMAISKGIDLEKNYTEIKNLETGKRMALDNLQFSNMEDRMKSMQQALNESIYNLGVETAKALGTAAGKIALGQGGLEQMFWEIINVFGQFLVEFGTALIMFSDAMIALKDAIKTGQFEAAIPVGIAAIALGTVLMGLASRGPQWNEEGGTAQSNTGGQTYGIKKMDQGGLLKGPQLVLAGEYAGARENPEVYMPLDKLQSLLDSNGGGGVLTAVVSGKDLKFVLDQEYKFRHRT